MKSFYKNILLILTLGSFLLASDPYEKRFSEIYHKQLWGTQNASGEGSLPENLTPYLEFLTHFIEEKKIRSLLDLGCGDFSYMKTLDLSGIDYIGIEIVSDLVEKNQKNYGSSSVNFVQGNILDVDLPEADLVICKHVLQHLPNEAVFIVLERLKKYRYCLLIDQVGSDAICNEDLPLGKSRPLDLFAPPFNLSATYVGKFLIANHPHQIVLIENNEK